MIREDGKYLGSGRYELTCLQCGIKFRARRRDAKYCPDGRCRQIVARRKKDLQRASNNAISQIRTVQQLMHKYPDLEFVGALELERITKALSVRTTGITEITAVKAVTLAAVTDKPCIKCGKLTTLSPSSFMCIDCLRSTVANS